MSESTEPAESIFAVAAELVHREEQAAFLERACAGDADLRARVEALLRAHAQTGHMLDRPAHDIPLRDIGQGSVPELAASRSPEMQPGVVISQRYKLLELIGEGGMGTVWAAEQLQPVRRKVALKLIKPGMDSKTVLARFEAERQALAVLDHPNIAKVLDGGATDNGRPYFVMEYVKGVPITEYCETVRLSISDRLQLVLDVCAAVQHAHQKGIIHRDLKPSNILVAPYDDRPVPKVIDFGLAKAMNRSLTEQTLFTAHETVLGTPLYMSPEQAQLNNLDVDTRSDIYSLGVLVYELLTGTTPLEKQRVRAAAWEEVKRLIREDDPPTPSTRLSSTEMLPSLAACRQTEPARLTREVRGELDWIVMKSLEKDRSRRYQTANGLAMDIQRYLTGEAVLAAPPSLRYRLGKLVRRHRTALTIAAVIALLLVGATAVSVWQAMRATRAEAAATQRADGERLARLDAQTQKDKAEKAAAAEKLANANAQKRLVQIEKTNEILGSIFAEMNPRAISRAERPLQAIMADKLDKAIAQLDGEAIGDPLVVATMQVNLGRAMVALWEAHKAIPPLEKALATRRKLLGPNNEDTIESMTLLAAAYGEDRKLPLAVPLYEEALEMDKATFGLHDLRTISGISNLAGVYHDTGRNDVALPLLEEALKERRRLDAEPLGTVACMTNLAAAYRTAGKSDVAIQLFEEALNLSRTKLGPKDPRTVTVLTPLASAYKAAGKLDLAVPLLEDAYKIQIELRGPAHPNTLEALKRLAAAYKAAKKLELALPLYQKLLSLQTTKSGPDDPESIAAANTLANAYLLLHQPEKAILLFEDSLERERVMFGNRDAKTRATLMGLFVAYANAGRFAEALWLLDEANVPNSVNGVF